MGVENPERGIACQIKAAHKLGAGVAQLDRHRGQAIILGDTLGQCEQAVGCETNVGRGIKRAEQIGGPTGERGDRVAQKGARFAAASVLCRIADVQGVARRGAGAIVHQPMMP